MAQGRLSRYPDGVVWRHPADDLPDAHAHQPRTVFLPVETHLADERPPAKAPPTPDDTTADGTTPDGTMPGGTAGESEVRRRDSAAIRAACSCGWRGPRLAITQQGGGHGPAEIDREVETLQRRRPQGQWESHLREVVPTLELHLHMPHVRYLDAELAAAVAHARRHEASWAAIAAACSRPGAGVVMSRQAAQQRWGASLAASDAPGKRAAMPVVTGWPGLPGWAHPAAGLDAAAAHAHRPRTVWVRRSGGEAEHRTKASTGLRPGCGCGWRGSPRPVPDEPPSRMPDAVAALERGFGREWGRHLYTAVATLRIREVLDLMAGVHADLDAAVAHARRGHASWQDIADVVGTRRQSAHQRWRHLDHASPRTPAGQPREPEANLSAAAPTDSPTTSPAGTAVRSRADSASAKPARVRKAPPLLRPAGH